MDLTGPSPLAQAALNPRPDNTWLEPMPDAWLEVADTSPGPEARYEAREAVELAFVATLQRLAPRARVRRPGLRRITS